MVLVGAPGDLDGRPRQDAEAREPPEEHEKLGDSEVADGAETGPHVGHVEALVEGRVRERGTVPGPQVRESARRAAGQQARQRPRSAAAWATSAGFGLREGGRADGRVEAVPGAREAPEALDDVRGPARDVLRQLLQDLDGALAAAVVDRVGDVEALGGARRGC